MQNRCEWLSIQIALHGFSFYRKHHIFRMAFAVSRIPEN
jgi:hypothetical protein